MKVSLDYHCRHTRDDMPTVTTFSCEVVLRWIHERKCTDTQDRSSRLTSRIACTYVG